MSTARRTAPGLRASAAALAALALGGCGIRSTPVPVDAGPAPSRASCTAPAVEDEGGPGDEGVRADVFLVCGGTVSAVERTVAPGGSGPDAEPGPEARLETARELLRELRRNPSRAEREAGFGSSVPGDLEIGGPGDGDPGEALRLSRDPGGLPSFALAQIVCTFTGTAAVGRDGSVVLGGPDRDGGGEPPLRYSCTDALRGSPEAAKTAGAPLP
ncbi:hypothetical protein IQ279_15685 [Streptomyces verrucosisporus]|uniref:hypothetical protein n=1 Tax=Streptomyces verrucosisporus TaxID=1695161 RepID=UPI0019CFBA76|nr:hypothetical protein [Streptomyces verrucosisporus]MBN3931057.1 hypothetical protein [Streptomyces verrucosisporus]